MVAVVSISFLALCSVVLCLGWFDLACYLVNAISARNGIVRLCSVLPARHYGCRVTAAVLQ